MSLEDWPLPAPPRFIGSNIIIPPFFHCGHPYTKWMLNMLRGGASFRISTMIKERPELFQQIYQIPDCPDLVRNENRDMISMFNRHTVLFLNPLCLAVYMKKEKSAELILKSGLNNANQKCWASEVFSRSQSSRGDLLEIYPICIAIRREYFEVIPILIHCEVRNFGLLSKYSKFDVTEKIEIHYENGEGRKVFRYKDSLQYAIDTLKRRGNLPLSRLLELFIIDCPNLFNPFKLDEDKNGNAFSLFNRIAKVAYYDDPDCRICLQLIQCLEVLLKHRCVPWNGITYDLKSAQYSLNNSQNNEKEQDVVVKDHSSSIGLLLGLYNQIQKRVKNGPLDNLGYLIIKALQITQWIDEFTLITPEEIQNKYGKVNSEIIVPLDTAAFVKRHILAIMELEKEREFKSNIVARSKTVSFMKRYHRRSCSLIEQCEPSGAQNLLQARVTNTNCVVPECSSMQTFVKPIKQSVEPLKSEELVPLFVYQTGVNNCETQTGGNSPIPNNNYLIANEEVLPSTIESEKCEQIEIKKQNIIPELYKKYYLDQEERYNYSFTDLPLDLSDLSEANSPVNCMDITSIKSCHNHVYTEPEDNMQTVKHNQIPGICKRNSRHPIEVTNYPYENQPYDTTEISDSNSTVNCLEMTPIKSCQKIMNEIYSFPSNNHNVHPSGDISNKYNNYSISSNNSISSTSFKRFLKADQLKLRSKFNFYDDLDLIDDFTILNRGDDESDLSMDQSEDERILNFEDELLDEFFIEYNEFSRPCGWDSLGFSKNKLKTIGEKPYISKRCNRKYVNNSLFNLSSDDNFSTM